MSPRNKIHQLLSHPAVAPTADTPEPTIDTQTDEKRLPDPIAWSSFKQYLGNIC